MFGVLGSGRALGCGSRRVFWQHVCGTCVALGGQQGQPARGALHFDAVLLSLLCAFQGEAAPPTILHTCPLRGPSFRASIVSPLSQGTQIAAAYHGLMLSSKVRDAVADRDVLPSLLQSALEAPLLRWASRLQKRGLAHVERFLAAPGGGRREARSLQGLLPRVEEQAALEMELSAAPRAGGCSPEELVLRACRLTEDCVGEAFAVTSVGMAAAGNEEPLRQAGKLFGRIMYLMDAVQDYWRDLRQGSYNPLVQHVPASQVYELSFSMYQSAHEELLSYLEQCPVIRQHSQWAILVRLLSEELQQRCVATVRRFRRPDWRPALVQHSCNSSSSQVEPKKDKPSEGAPSRGPVTGAAGAGAAGAVLSSGAGGGGVGGQQDKSDDNCQGDWCSSCDCCAEGCSCACDCCEC